MSPRRNVNPAARRRTIALFAVVVAVIAGMLVAPLLTRGAAHFRVPSVRGLSRGAVDRKLHRGHLNARFTSMYSAAPRGTAIGQHPAAGARLTGGSTVAVTLSGGPPPVAVPRVVGISATDAQTALRRLGLRVTTSTVVAPGVAAGTVTGQSPQAGAELFPANTVLLKVAEQPQWRTITSFTNAQASVPFRIRGPHWRVLYSMSFQGMCTFIVFCSGPSAQVADLGRSRSVTSFDLNDGSDQIRTIESGPGLYQLRLSPGSDAAAWNVRVQDYY